MVHIPSALAQKSSHDQDMGLFGVCCLWLMCYLTVLISRHYMGPSQELKHFFFAVEKKCNPFWQGFFVCFWVFFGFLQCLRRNITSLFNWVHLKDFITCRRMVWFCYTKTTLYNIGTRTGYLNGPSYIPLFDDSFAVPGINVNKTWDLDTFLFFNKYFHQNFLSSHEISFVLKRKYVLEKEVSNWV